MTSTSIRIVTAADRMRRVRAVLTTVAWRRGGIRSAWATVLLAGLWLLL